jgi:hypothetical protein
MLRHYPQSSREDNLEYIGTRLMPHTLLDASIHFGFLHYCVLWSDVLVIHCSSNFNAVIWTILVLI